MNRQPHRGIVFWLAMVLLALGLAACSSTPATPTARPAAPTGAAILPAPAKPTQPLAPPTKPPVAPQPTAAPQPAATALPRTPVAPTAPSSQADWERIKAAGKMVVGTSADYAPFSYHTQDFKIDGFDPALITELGKRLGIEVQIKDFAFDGLGGALELGQIDSAIAALSVTPQRAELMAFTHPYYAGEGAALARPDYNGITIRLPENMAGMRIGVQTGSVYETFAQNTLVETGLTPPENVVPYADIRQAMDDLKAQKLDIVLLDYLPAQTYVSSGDAKMVGRAVNQQTYAIATRLDSSLLPQLNAALDQVLADGTVARLAEQYLQVNASDVVNPPEPTATPQPTPTTTALPPTATPVPPCIDGMAWVADLNLDDHGMTSPPVMQPNQGFTKMWRVRNSGTCPWLPTFALVYVQGNVPAARMNGQPLIIGHEVPVNGTIDLSLNLIAPAEPGVYQGIWQMRNDQGVPFGERIWVGIQVPGAPTPVPVPPTVAPPQPVPPPFIVNFSVNPNQIQQGQCVGIDWEVQGNISWVRILVNNGVRWDGQPTRGHLSDCPGGPGTVQYSIESGGPGGTSRQDRTVQVNQQPQQPAPNIDYFSPSTDRVRPGQCLDLSWGISGGTPDYVRLQRNGQEIMSNTGARRFTDCPTTVGVTTYTLITGNSAGEKRASAQVQVIASQ